MEKTQKKLFEIAQKCCFNMYADSLIRLNAYIEEVLDRLCPEWRHIPPEDRRHWGELTDTESQLIENLMKKHKGEEF